MEKKSVEDNSSGTAGVVFGILSIISSIVPFIGILFGIISLIFGIVQVKKPHKGWGRVSIILSIIGIVISIIIWVIAATLLTRYASQFYA